MEWKYKFKGKKRNKPMTFPVVREENLFMYFSENNDKYQILSFKFIWIYSKEDTAILFFVSVLFHTGYFTLCNHLK